MSKDGTKAGLQSLLREAGIGFELSEGFHRKIVLSLNGSKGKTGEFLVFAAILSLLREAGHVDAGAIPRPQHLLPTPEGGRRIDLYFLETGLAVEIKAGRVRSTAEFRKQVRKDAWLLQNRVDAVSEVLWIFLAGATVPAQRFLEVHGIAWLALNTSN